MAALEMPPSLSPPVAACVFSRLHGGGVVVGALSPPVARRGHASLSTDMDTCHGVVGRGYASLLRHCCVTVASLLTDVDTIILGNSTPL